MSVVLYQGIGPPYVVRVRLASSFEFDPLVVTEVLLELEKPKGTTVEWSTAILSQTSEAILVQYPLQSVDLNEEGWWKVYARCDVPGGSLRTEVGVFFVGSPFRRL